MISKIADFLRPAITRYNGFPIFQRRYPRRLFDSAFDLFLGKPALVVEHHEYFRKGCGAMEEFVAGLYELEPALSWPTFDHSIVAELPAENIYRTVRLRSSSSPGDSNWPIAKRTRADLY